MNLDFALVIFALTIIVLTIISENRTEIADKALDAFSKLANKIANSWDRQNY